MTPLPTLPGAPRFLTDGGLETTMIFHEGLDLPHFAAFTLLDSAAGRAKLTDYALRYIDLAKARGMGFLLDTPTWRANLPWCRVMGLTEGEMQAINTRCAHFARALAEREAVPSTPILVNGIIGPAGDGYAPDAKLSPAQALNLHAPQIQALGRAGVDVISAMTMTHVEEAIGIARAGKEIDLPTVISFTVETDGALPSGQRLGEAIEQTDAETGASPLYYMINCAHPDHFRDALTADERWLTRIGGLRANASRQSHAELDAAEVLDEGNPEELGDLHAELMSLLPGLRVLGGCCGTDHRHVGCIARKTTAPVAA